MGKDTLRWHVLTCPLWSSVATAAAEEGKGGQRVAPKKNAGAKGLSKVSGHLSRGVVFIVPPGRPIITIAAKNQNLQIVCFDVNAPNNEKFPFAGLLATFFGLKLS
ncbi:Sucrose-binding protein [Camellia lanceoleosa]|uniref:Sucrose-binding protein n=1 Tax=Camellia lanceoleosa TaxID=1840588 RepID=A0ACC0G5H2_9ERIC|nr:Sucrose-binding protein [Camellia lanceoleosa]